MRDSTRRFLMFTLLPVAAAALILWFTGCHSCLTILHIWHEFPAGNLGKYINSSDDDFAPFLLDSTTLLFTSNRGGTGSGYISPENRYGEDIFVANYESGKWSEAKILPRPASSSLNEGTPAIAADGRTAIIARSYGENSVGGTDLYRATFDGKTFVHIENLGAAVNSKYWDSQPTLSRDGSMLIFASDRPGGYGGVDLWMTIREKGGVWSAPVNLGATINTPGDEYSPFIASDGITLFFASDGGKESTGKLDIYYAYYQGDIHWSEARALGGIFNSPSNDAFPCLSSDRTKLYFASDRQGGCGGYDLYAGLLPQDVFIYRATLAGTVRDTLGAPLEESVEMMIREKKTNKVVASIQTHPPQSTYETPLMAGATYILTAKAANFYESQPAEIVIVPKPVDQRLIKDVFLVPHRLTLQPGGYVEFDLKEYNIPFFVTGYYRLNVPENLTKLRQLFSTKLKGVPYIEYPGSKYDGYALEVKRIFNDSLEVAMVDTILPMFRKRAKPNEYLEIQIVGYADPREISGRYVENDIFYGNIVVRFNDQMTNETLSALRAYYTMQYVDEILSSSADYAALKSSGKILYVIKGAGVDVSPGKPYDARRRVKIIVSRKVR
ncbi:MAG: TolB family protein [Bacteroidota bacterium]